MTIYFRKIQFLELNYIELIKDVCSFHDIIYRA